MEDKNQIPFEDDMETSEEAINLQFPEDDAEAVVGMLMDTESVQYSTYSKKEFDKGLKDFSYYAGAFTALANAGVSATNAINCILNIEALKVNESMTKMRCEAQVESAKFIRDNMEKEMI